MQKGKRERERERERGRERERERERERKRERVREIWGGGVERKGKETDREAELDIKLTVKA